MRPRVTNKIIRSPKVITKKIGQKMIILDPFVGEVRTLNETAGFIWKNIGKGATVRDLSKKISQTFEVSLKKAEEDTIYFLERYLKAGLIEIKK